MNAHNYIFMFFLNSGDIDECLLLPGVVLFAAHTVGLSAGQDRGSVQAGTWPQQALLSLWKQRPSDKS